jgi:UDP-N-acetylglucosamine/UDP-N-acetylgalactosamine diphosphorylase
LLKTDLAFYRLPKRVGMNKKSFLTLLTLHNQDHIIDHFNALAPDKQSTLIKNNADLDLELVFQLHKKYCASKGAVTLTGEIKPARVIPLPKTPDEKKYQNDAKLIGESLISREKLAVLIVAGGQGVRLGHNKPKGTFPISPVMNKTLFHLFRNR